LLNSLAKALLRPVIQRKPLFFLAEGLPRSPIQTIEFRVPPGAPLDVGGTMLRLRVDSVIMPHVLSTGSWQPEDAEFLASHASTGAQCVLIDVGANAGLITREVAKALGSRLVAAYCYEPDAVNFEALTFNLAPVPAVHAIACGLADAPGEAKLYRDVHNSGNLSLSPMAVESASADVETIRLLGAREEITRLRRAHPDARFIWKSDTQGHDEVILERVPLDFWTSVDAALVELWRIERPKVDPASLAPVFEAFPHRQFEPHGPQVSVGEILAFLGGPLDGKSVDLRLSR
jgi:FkbM family methyltransferase